MRFVVPVVAIIVVIVAIVALAPAFDGRGPAVTQPIAFNHTLHLEEAGLECVDCHKTAPTGVYAGLPGKEICFDCHDIDELEEQSESGEVDPELAKLIPFADGVEDLPWERVATSRPDVFFSHRRHVTSGKLDCLRCHADQPTLSAPPPYASLVMSMDACLDCHQESNVSTDCLACHR